VARVDLAGEPAFGVTGVVVGRTTVIILHYRGVADTLGCVASVVPQCHDGLDLLVVDNGSSDGVAAVMAAEWPDVPVLRLAVNAGWAGGNNAGIDWARQRGATVVCLLNNDTVVPAGVFDRLAAVAAAVGPCLLHPAIDFADPAEGTQLDPSKAPGAMPLAGFSSLYAMNYAYGACLMVPMVVFDWIGGFDERFFLQLEEADFHERAKRVGIASVCETSVRIVHAESRSFGGRVTVDKTYYKTRNTLLLMMKNWRNFGLVRYFLRQLYWNAAALAQPDGQSRLDETVRWLASADDHAAAVREGVRDFALRRFGARRRA
jgi:GT2 family glycosyltransferase